MAVDDPGRVGAQRRDALAPGLDVLRQASPRDVLDDAAAEAALLGRRGIDLVPAAPQPAPRLPAALADRRHLEHLAHERAARVGVGGVGLHAVEALQGVLRRDFGRVARQRRVVGVDDREPVARGPRGRRTRARLRARSLSTPSPARRRSQKSSAASSPTRQTIVCTLPAPARPCGRPAVLEEADVVAVGGLLVPVEDVVGRLVGLVDGLLDDPQPEHADVEVGVAGSVGGDAGDVVDALEPHGVLPFPSTSFAIACDILRGMGCAGKGPASSLVPRRAARRTWHALRFGARTQTASDDPIEPLREGTLRRGV